MEQPEVNLGEWFEKGFKLYRENMLKMIAASFVALILTAASAGVLAGPMLTGLLMMPLASLRGGDPEVFDVFKGFRFFLNATLFVLGWGLTVTAGALILLMLPGIGALALLFFVYSALAFLMFGPFLIVDRGMDFWSATRVSFDTVKSNFWPFLSVSAAAGVIGSMGCILFGIGVIVTVPFQACILTVAYEAVLGEKVPVK
jgi:uncharacterized membrane protein